jgi:hypothetical protein
MVKGRSPAKGVHRLQRGLGNWRSWMGVLICERLSRRAKRAMRHRVMREQLWNCQPPNGIEGGTRHARIPWHFYGVGVHASREEGPEAFSTAQLQPLSL